MSMHVTSPASYSADAKVFLHARPYTAAGGGGKVIGVVRGSFSWGIDHKITAEMGAQDQ